MVPPRCGLARCRVMQASWSGINLSLVDLSQDQIHSKLSCCTPFGQQWPGVSEWDAESGSLPEQVNGGTFPFDVDRCSEIKGIFKAAASMGPLMFRGLPVVT